MRASLVDAAKLTVDTINQAAAQRAELTQAEAAQHDELVALEAKANALAAELEDLRTAHRNFKFAREKDDSGVLDLPPFLPRPAA